MMEDKCFPAHIRKDAEAAIQTVEQHCAKTAQYTGEYLSAVGLERTGVLLGLIHDCGKLTDRFTTYIQRASRGENVRKGSVNHTFAAVKLILNRFHSGDNYRKLTAELIACALGAHHGCFDCVSPERQNGFTHRLESEEELYREASENFFRRCCSSSELERLFAEAHAELAPLLSRLVDLSRQSGAELSFYFGCLSRLLLSALIDGDRRDTAEFMTAAELANRHLSLAQWKKLQDHVEEKLAELQDSAEPPRTQCEAEIRRSRFCISKMCRDRAQAPGGIYRLNLPTGAGKTLSSLRYALAHTIAHKKERIIFVSPLLSILEQNAAVIRAFLGNEEIILEHHSNVIRADSEQDSLSRNELLTDSWNSPVIITTLVQLLNTMFSGKTTAIRRFQALCRSVIVIDEVQTLPSKLLTLFQLMVSFLAEVCGATVLLCSATQPADEYTPHPFFRMPEPLVPYDPKLWKVFLRTKLEEAKPLSLRDIPSFAEEVLSQHDSLLIVCNTKKEAAFLFRELNVPNCDCFHLSAAMCAAHRTEMLNALGESLKDSTRKTLCVSTQVIEAGVDISFSCVIRLTAGMDNVVQSAGRCNRNGESETPAPVYILNCKDENLSHLYEIAQAKNATAELLAEYQNNADAFQWDLSSDTAIRYYYERLYSGIPADSLDYPVGEHGTLFDLLADNTKYATEDSESYGQYFLCQSFKTAGQLFSVFDAQTDTLLVPYGKGAEIIQSIQKNGERSDPESLRKLRDLAAQAKPYSISVFPYQIEQLERLGAIDRICGDSILCLQPNLLGDIHYKDDIGLMTEKG